MRPAIPFCVLLALLFVSSWALARNPQSVAFSPDGKIVALGVGGSPENHYLTWERFGHIDLWNTETGQPVRRIAHHGDVTDLVFSPDGSLLASVGLYTPGDSVNGNAVRIIDVQSGDKIHGFSRGNVFAFSPIGKGIVVTTRHRTALYAMRTWQQLVVFPDLKDSVLSLAFSPDGRQLAAVTHDRAGTRLLICDADTGKLLRSMGKLDLFYRAVFSPDGQWIATGEKGRVRLWKAGTLQEVRTLEMPGAELTHPLFSPDGKLVGVAGQDSPKITLWDIKTGQEVRSFSFENGRLETVYARFRGTRVRPESAPARVRFSPHGKSLAVGYDDGILIDARSGKVQFHLPSDAIKSPRKPEENLYAKYLQEDGVETDLAGIRTFLRTLLPVEQGPERGQELVQALGSDSFLERESATKELQQQVFAYAGILSRAAGSVDQETAARARRILKKHDEFLTGKLFYALEHVARGELPVSKTLLPIIALLPQDKPLLHSARQALLAAVRSEDVAELQASLGSDNPTVRRMAAAGLARLAERQNADSLARLLRDKDPEVRLEAAIGAVNSGKRTGLPVLVDLLEAKETSPSVAERQALRALTGHSEGYWPAVAVASRREGVARWRDWAEKQADQVKLNTPYRETWNRILVWMVNGGVREIDSRGQVTGEFRGRGSITDAKGLPNGHRLVAYYSSKHCQVSEYDRRGTEVWNSGKLSSYIAAAERLPNGNTLVGLLNVHLLQEIGPQQDVVWQEQRTFREEPFDIDILDNGDWLIAEARSNRVVQIDRQRNVVWSVGDQPDVICAQRLANGNTLVGCRSLGEVRELDPQGKMVWSVSGYSRFSSAQRLPNGCTLIATEGKGVVVLDRHQRVVRRLENLTNNRAQGAWAY